LVLVKDGGGNPTELMFSIDALEMAQIVWVSIMMLALSKGNIGLLDGARRVLMVLFVPLVSLDGL
jgi:hypothetical protein